MGRREALEEDIPGKTEWDKGPIQRSTQVGSDNLSEATTLALVLNPGARVARLEAKAIAASDRLKEELVNERWRLRMGLDQG